MCFSCTEIFRFCCCRTTRFRLYPISLSVVVCILTPMFTHLFFQLVWLVPVSALPTAVVCTCSYVVWCFSSWCGLSLCLCSLLGCGRGLVMGRMFRYIQRDWAAELVLAEQYPVGDGGDWPQSGGRSLTCLQPGRGSFLQIYELHH